MNVPEGVNTEVENLLSRIPIRDLTFCDTFLQCYKILQNLTFLEKGSRDPQGLIAILHFPKL